LESLLETIHRLEAERALEADSRELSELCLQEELATTKDQLRAAQEDASNAHRELDLGRETLQKTRAHAKVFKRELETCRAKLKDVRVARRADILKFCQAVELLRLRGADLEALRAEAEASQSKHSQAVSLTAVLQERVAILEAEVKSLNRNQKCADMHPAYANSQLFCTADTGLCTFRDFYSVVC
jgi:outer membrane murein-binding lipoprotein Lpp